MSNEKLSIGNKINHTGSVPFLSGKVAVEPGQGEATFNLPSGKYVYAAEIPVKTIAVVTITATVSDLPCHTDSVSVTL
ncbi:MAG: hypothetical protein WCK34_05455 [Bacteroidota bacterium]